MTFFRDFFSMLRERPKLFVGIFALAFLTVFATRYVVATVTAINDPEVAAADSVLTPEQQIVSLPAAIQRQLAKTERYLFASDLAALDNYEFAKRIEASRVLGLEAAGLSDELLKRVTKYQQTVASSDDTETEAEPAHSTAVIAENIGAYFDNMVRRVALIDLNMGKGLLSDETGASVNGVSKAESASDYLISLRKLTDERNDILEKIKQAGAEIEQWYADHCHEHMDCASISTADLGLSR